MKNIVKFAVGNPVTICMIVFALLLLGKVSYDLWGIERSGFFNGREKWAKDFENQRV